MTKTTILKKVISILLAMTIIAGFLPAGVIQAKAAELYNPANAIEYAKEHCWDDDGTLCAEFVSDCLNAGGISAYSESSTSLYEQLKKSGLGNLEKIKINSDRTVSLPDYASLGDVVFYYCDYENLMIHTVLYNGNDANGNMKAFSHNNPNDGSTAYIYRNSCYGGCTAKINYAYLFHFNTVKLESPSSTPTLGDPVSVGDNFYAYIRGVDNKNLTIDDASTPNVILTPSSNKKQDGKEIWYFKKGSDGYYYIKNVATDGYLDVYTGKSGPNLNVVLWGTERDENDAATHWYIHKYNGKYVLRAQCSNSNVVLDIHRDWGDMAGTYEFHGEVNQLFTINKIDLSTYKPQNVTVSYNKNDASATVSWTANEKVDSQVSYYDIQIIRVSDNKVVKSKKNLTSRSYTFAELEDGEYYAKVIGRNKADPSNLKGIKDSSHFTAKRTVINVEKPTFTVFQKDKVYTAKFVTITSETSGSTIYYTTDGSTPSTSSKSLKNSGTIKISSNCTVKAIAVKSGFKSGTSSRYVFAGMKFGDADGNGKVNDDDFKAYLKDKFCIYNADVNGDGKITLTDESNLSFGEMPVKNAPTITHEKVTVGYKLTFETKAKASTLYYSTDGGNNYKTIKNGGSITIKESCTVKVYSKIYGVKSSTASKKITITKKKVETPEIDVTSVYNGKQVKLTCKTSGATIYYTTDGSKPTSSSKKYTGTLSIKASQTIKAVAIKDGMSDSSVISKSITVNKLNAPTADISSGSTVEKGTYLYLSADSGSTIYYTTDGSNPTTSSIKYTGKIKIEKDITIKAIAVRKGYLNSDINRFVYKVEKVTVKSPEFTISDIYGGKAVTITSKTKEASIYYTTDGSTPTKYSKKYTGKIDFENISGTIHLKAIAISDGASSKISKEDVYIATSEKPIITEEKVNGGKRITISANSADADIYYAIALLPNTNRFSDVKKYTGSFVVTEPSYIVAYVKEYGYHHSYESSLEVGIEGEKISKQLVSMLDWAENGIGISTSPSLSSYTIIDGKNETVKIPKRSVLDLPITVWSGERIDLEYIIKFKNSSADIKTNLSSITIMIYIPSVAYNITCPGNYRYKGEYIIDSLSFLGYECTFDNLEIGTGYIREEILSFSMPPTCSSYIITEITAAKLYDDHFEYFMNYNPCSFISEIVYEIFTYTNWKKSVVISFKEITQGGIPSSMVGNNDNDSGLSASPAVGIFPFANQNLYA